MVTQNPPPPNLRAACSLSLRTRLRESLDAIPARQRALLFGLLGTVLFLGTAIAIYSVYDTIDTLEERMTPWGVRCATSSRSARPVGQSPRAQPGVAHRRQLASAFRLSGTDGQGSRHRDSRDQPAQP